VGGAERVLMFGADVVRTRLRLVSKYASFPHLRHFSCSSRFLLTTDCGKKSGNIWKYFIGRQSAANGRFAGANRRRRRSLHCAWRALQCNSVARRSERPARALTVDLFTRTVDSFT